MKLILIAKGFVSSMEGFGVTTKAKYCKKCNQGVLNNGRCGWCGARKEELSISIVLGPWTCDGIYCIAPEGCECRDEPIL